TATSIAVGNNALVIATSNALLGCLTTGCTGNPLRLTSTANAAFVAIYAPKSLAVWSDPGMNKITACALMQNTNGVMCNGPALGIMSGGPQPGPIAFTSMSEAVWMTNSGIYRQGMDL